VIENRAEYHTCVSQSCDDIAALGFSYPLSHYLPVKSPVEWLCHTLYRLALSSHAFATVLGIKNAVHRRKLSVKASDLVLFGPPKCKLILFR